MVSELDTRLADLAVEMQVIDRARMNQILAELEQLPAPTPLVNYLVSKGLIHQDGLVALKREWFQRNPRAQNNSGERPRGLTTRRQSSQLLMDGAPQTQQMNSDGPPMPVAAAPSPMAPPNPMAAPPNPMAAVPNPMAAAPNPMTPPAAASTPQPLSAAEVGSDQLLGRLLHAHQVVPQPVLKELLDTAQASRTRLGKLLIDRQLITVDRLTQALQYCQRMRRVCGKCSFVQDATQGVPLQCPKCAGAWFDDTVEGIMSGQPRANANAAQDAAIPPPIHAAPNAGAAPLTQNRDEMDFLKLPAGYSKNSGQNSWTNMVPTSSMRLHVSQLKQALAQDDNTESSDSDSSQDAGFEDLGKSMDELNILSGKSMDELNIMSGQSSDEMSVGGPAGLPDLSPIPPPLAAEPVAEAPMKDSDPNDKVLPASKSSARQPKAKKKGCFGKSALFLLALGGALYPIVAWAIN